MRAIFDVVFQHRFAQRFDLHEREAYVIGRSSECDIQIDHPTLSRQHALLFCHEGVWHLRDLNSTNGVFIDAQRAEEKALQQSSLCRLGDVVCMFVPHQNHSQQVAINQAQWCGRQLTQMRKSWQHSTSLQEVISTAQNTLSQVLQSDRTALVLLDDTYLLSPFDGSTTIVRQAIESGQPCVVHNAISHQQLQHRDSVKRQQIKAALAVPIALGNKIIAVLYADSLKQEHYFNEHQIFILQRFTQLIAMQLTLCQLNDYLNLAQQRMATARELSNNVRTQGNL
ncbi:FHA domain-containing protein [Pseudidiomarina marina]|uniref:FHA domain-containing protein n=1 Tax=Pseudidiomarina marina TaxID=502366 RepID=A0A432YGU7_9GAMM|nr:FHA domain-containing protein [Pseudidiomarina marina]PHR65654.1 MAG: hypothetical protein COA51_05105 [Idiomarina sp.]RUO60150.1 hypothetical protein CWI76_08520 [Pseudidiomarina marina]